ncbi:hypothetical protein PoMZ_04314 [Pyricularia oryzae]|uniref:Uncharacterized protein n=1 Tax=Pyricularia oryzae TaxID=318829 RepID=A0A4P7N9Z1_PYROR|nr:hypothetical protein PoMZ_04314 [Pyricularia oryzae]
MATSRSTEKASMRLQNFTEAKSRAKSTKYVDCQDRPTSNNKFLIVSSFWGHKNNPSPRPN